MKNTNILPEWQKKITDFIPGDAREAAEQKAILEQAEKEGDALLYRTHALAHLTASSIIVNPQRTKTLMIWHNIYKSWAWTGGHCDGDGDFEAVARREAEEETGISGLKRLGNGIASLEILPVWSHIKRGETIGTHLHLNVSYLFEADERIPIHFCPEENSGAAWLEIDKLSELCSEEFMLPFYFRLIKRANVC